MKIYNKKEQGGQREIKKVQFGMRRSTSTGKYNGAKTSFQGDKLIKKKKPDAKWDKGSSNLTVRPHPAKLPAWENHQRQKADAKVTERRDQVPSSSPSKE